MAMNKVSHFEIAVDDIERASKFYSDTFGWNIHTQDVGGGMTYTSAITTPENEQHVPTEPGAINGSLTARSFGALKAPTVTIQVDSIKDHMEKIKANGGKEIMPATQVQGGWFAYFEDSENNIVSLWQNA